MESNTATSGANADTSGSAQSDVQSQPAATSGADGSSYSPAFVEKLKKEKDNYARNSGELKARLVELEQQLVERQQNELQEKEQFKTLWEQEKERSAQFQAKLTEFETQMVESKKRAAVKEELVKLGLNPAHEQTAFRLMDSSSVMVDKDTGAIIGAEEAAKGFHEMFQDLGIFGKPVPGVSHSAPTPQNTVGNEDYSKLSQEEIIARLKQLG